MRGLRGRANLVDTQEMDAFFESLDHMNQVQLRAMRAVWGAISREEHEDAWATVRAVAVRDGLTKEIDRVRDRAMAWATRSPNLAPSLYEVSGSMSGFAADWQQTKIEAGEAIIDAALAVALGDRLDERTRATLLAAWDRAT